MLTNHALCVFTLFLKGVVPEEHKALQLVAPNNGVGGMVTPTAVAAAAAAAATAATTAATATATATATPGAGLLPTPTQPLLGQVRDVTLM